MNNYARKLIALAVVVSILLGSIPALPAAAFTPATLSIANDNIEAIVSTKNGGFSIRTGEGDVLTKDDNNKDLLYRRDDFDTSFTSFMVTTDGSTKEYIFGNNYSFLGLGGNNLTVTRTDTTIRSTWTVGGLTFTQVLEPVLNKESHQHGTVRVSYSVQNGTGKPVEVKARLLLDTALGNQDYAYYEVAQQDTGSSFLRIEKELVLDTGEGDYLPATFFAYDNYENPTIAAYTIRDESTSAVIPYKIAFGHWNNLASTVFEFTPNPDLTFTNRYNKAYLTADSAFALYYDLGTIATGEQGKTVSTYYGVDSRVRVKDSDRVGLTITAPPVLNLSTDKMTYLGPDPSLPDGDFEITVDVTNIPRPGAEALTHIAVALFLDNGLTPLDESGEEIWPTPTNDAPYYAELGNIAVGEVRQLTFKCRADVFSETTYRKLVLRSYNMSAPNAELLLLDNLLGSSISYVLCPGNNSTPPVMTFTGISPQAIYKEGKRHLNITGTGFDNLHSDYYNLRAYLKTDRSINFDISKSDISSSKPGELQIILTQDMPVGEYELVFHWSPDGAQWGYPVGDKTAPSLSFFVTDDPAQKNDQYTVIAIVKQGSMPNTYYSIWPFANEEDYESFGDRDKVLLTFRGPFILGAPLFGNGIESCYAVSTSSKDIININSSLDFEKGNLHIFQQNNTVHVEFDGDLYTTKSRTKVWQGSGSLTPLANKADFGLIKYNERGERLFGQQPGNPISVVWSGGYSMLQTIGGMAVDLRYGQFAAMYGGSNNSDFKGHVISFGGKLDLSFLMPGGAKQSQELERQAQAENKTDSVSTKIEDGVVKQDVSGYSPSEKAKAENEKNKVKPAGKVNIEDVLYGLNKGFLGFNSQAEVMLPKYFAALPAMGGTLSINTIGGYDVGVKGITKTKKFDLEFDLQVKSAPGSDIPVPNKIYFFMGGFEPGVNVDSAGAFWITGLGGGVDKLYDTIFSTGGLPPLTLLLSAEYDIIKAMSGRADLALSLYGFMINMSNIKLKNTNVVVVKNGQLAVEWTPDFYLHLAAYIELYDIIGGKAYIVVDDGFYELFTRTTVNVPKDVKVVGGMTIAGVDLGGNNDKLWGTLSALGIKLGINYYWGGSTVHFGTGAQTATPTYPELLGVAAVPVSVDEETGETLYMHIGSNLYAVDTLLVEGFDNLAPVLLALEPSLASNLSKTIHRLNLGDDTGDDAAVCVKFTGDSRPKNDAEAKDALDIRKPDGSAYELTFYDGTNPTTANANLIVDDAANATSINFTITEYVAGDWALTTTQTADLVLYTVGAIPEVTSLTAGYNTETAKLSLTWTGSMLDQTRINIYATPDIGEAGTDNIGEMGTLVATLGGPDSAEAPLATGQTLEIELPPHLPSGAYYVRLNLSNAEQTNQTIAAKVEDDVFSFTHHNLVQPDVPGGVTLENCGNSMFRVNIATPPTASYDGYQISIYESTADGLLPTTFIGIPFAKEADGVLPELVVGGSIYSTDGVSYGLIGGKDYVAKVSAIVIADSGTPSDSGDDVLICGAEVVTTAVTLRAPTPPAITFSPTPGTFKSISKTVQVDEHTTETISIPTFASQNVSFSLNSDMPLKGYWSLNGALTLDLLDPTSSSIQEVTNTSMVSINEHLVDGEHTVTLVGTNAQGDNFIFSQIFAVDTTPPKLLLRSPINGSSFATDGYLPISGIGEPDSLYTISVDGEEVALNQVIPTDASGAFTYDLWVDPSVSEHQVRVQAVDAVGNSVMYTSLVKHSGFANLTDVGLTMNGTVFTNKHLLLDTTSTTSAQLNLLGLSSGDTSFVIDDSRMVSWSVQTLEGSATIDQDGSLVISPGSVGFVEGSLHVLDTFSLTATMTFGSAVSIQEPYQLSLANTVGGTVTGNEGLYVEGAPVVLSATPAAGYQFNGWSSSNGASFEDATQATTTLTMPASHTVVTAQFSPQQYQLSLVSTVGGTVTSIEGLYVEAVPVALRATPEAGYKFTGWISSNGGSFGDSTQAVTTFTMPASNTVVTAQFSPEPYQLSLNSPVGGTITGTEGMYVVGNQVALSATPAAGYIFISWSSSHGGSFADALQTATVFTMPTSNTVITALFIPISEQHHLLITNTVGGTVSGLEGPYPAGAQVALSATPSSGFRFNGWSSSHGGSFADASQATTVFTMPASSTVITARFRHIKSTPVVDYPPQPITSGSRITIFSNKLQLAALPIKSELVTLPDGSTAESIVLATTLAPTIRSNKNMGATHATIQLEPKTAQSAAGVTISTEVLQALAGMDLTILTPHASLTLPAALVNSLGTLGQPLPIVMEQVTLDDLAGLLPAGTDALGSSVLNVRTDLRGRTKVTIPLNIELPTSEQERQDLLNELMVFILHSDNSRQTVHDVEFNLDALTQALKSISFWVDSFSSFTLVKPNYQALSTTVGLSNFSLNGVTRDMVACYYKGNDTMMPIRMLEDFGVNLAWDEATKTATMTYKSSSVTLTIGSTYATINGVETPIIGASGLAVAPELAPGRTMIPLRFVSEHLGFTVTWDPSHIVTIQLRE